MGSPAIFSGKRTKLLTTKGVLNSDTSINDNDGVLNYIKNGHAEVNALGWATYKDAAGILPVDGTGGTPTHITFTQTSTAPLGGLGSFLVTNSGSTSAQGEGASYNFTIDAKDQAKVLQINFDYLVNSGTFVAGSSGVDSDLEVYLYDVTNALIIQPSSYKLLSNNTTLTDKFSATFQTASNSTSYRLILHCPTTATAAWSIKLDNVTVSPSQYVYGSPVTDWQSYTPTWSSDGTVPTVGNGTVNGVWRRVGDSMEVRTRVNFGSTSTKGTGNYSISIPLGFSIDTSKLTSGIQTTNSLGIGNYLSNLTTTAAQVQSILLNSSTSVRASTDQNSISNIFSSGQTNVFNATGDVWFLNFKVPILGWSSNVQMSDSADTRVVAARYTVAASTALTGAQPTNFSTKDFDTHNAVTTGASWNFKAPVSGIYSVSTNQDTVAANSVQLFKNGSFYQYLTSNAANIVGCGNCLISLNAGETIDVRATVSSTTQVIQSIDIYRLSGPSAIAATETVAASYWLSANFTSSATIPVNFDSKEYDTHGAVTTSATAWKFTAPISGLYSVTHYLQQLTAAAGNLAITLYKNGSAYKLFALQNGTITGSNATLNLRLIAGDYIDIRSSVSQAYIGGSLATAFTSHVEITRVGN